jgi:hypothetical protein
MQKSKPPKVHLNPYNYEYAGSFLGQAFLQTCTVYREPSISTDY